MQPIEDSVKQTQGAICSELMARLKPLKLVAVS